MELICSTCFIEPVPSGMHQDGDEWVLCSAVDPGYSIDTQTGIAPLRCGHCGARVTIARHHLAWYTH